MRTAGLDSSQGPTAAKYILGTVKPQRIAIIHDKQQYGEGLARSVQEGLKAGGANIVFFDGITAGEKDFSALVARLKKENIDFVYYGGYYPEMGQILRQARANGLQTQFMGPEGVGNASLSNIAGDAAEGMLVTMPKRYDQDPANQAIVDALKAEKKDPSGPYVWITYAAVQSLAQAMERSGSNEPLALVKDLKANGAKTVIGPLNWDEKGDLKGFDFGVFQWHADGSSTVAQIRQPLIIFRAADALAAFIHPRSRTICTLPGMNKLAAFLQLELFRVGGFNIPGLSGLEKVTLCPSSFSTSCSRCLTA